MSTSPPREELETLLEQAREAAFDYARKVGEMPVYPGPEARARLSVFDEPLPDTGTSGAEMLRLLHEVGSPATTAQTGGRYFGFVNGATHPPALAARWLADVWDQNTALAVMSPVVSQLEQTCERWLVDLFGMPEGTAAGFVSGTATAITCSLAAARNRLLEEQGWNVHRDGLFGAPPIRVVIGAEAHAAVERSLSILGLGCGRVERVPADSQGRMIAEQMPALDSRTLVIAQAGNVNSGAFDPFDEICERAQAAGAWVHVDGAFGLWAAASRSTAPLYAGAERADSWSVDAHKTLNAPYECGVVLCRDRSALVSALDATASYLVPGETRDSYTYTLDMSRRARAVDVWATLKTLGRRGVEQLVDQLCERARQFAQRLTQEGFAIVNDVVFNQVLVGFDSVERRDAVLANLRDSGECWCGGALWQGRPVVRISVCSWVTTPSDVERSAVAFVEALAATASGASS